MCLYSVPSACALCDFIDHILLLQNVFLRKKLDVNKHAAKLHFSLALMGSENEEEGGEVEPITITDCDLEVCPHLFLTCISV